MPLNGVDALQKHESAFANKPNRARAPLARPTARHNGTRPRNIVAGGGVSTRTGLNRRRLPTASRKCTFALLSQNSASQRQDPSPARSKHPKSGERARDAARHPARARNRGAAAERARAEARKTRPAPKFVHHAGQSVAPASHMRRRERLLAIMACIPAASSQAEAFPHTRGRPVRSMEARGSASMRAPRAQGRGPSARAAPPASQWRHPSRGVATLLHEPPTCLPRPRPGPPRAAARWRRWRPRTTRCPRGCCRPRPGPARRSPRSWPRARRQYGRT